MIESHHQSRKDKEKKMQEEADRIERAKIKPSEMFTSETDKYSAFDENGIPTLDADGKELPKTARKKLVKLWQKQNRLHIRYLEKNL